MEHPPLHELQRLMTGANNFLKDFHMPPQPMSLQLQMVPRAVSHFQLAILECMSHLRHTFVIFKGNDSNNFSILSLLFFHFPSYYQ